ncbi:MULTISPECIES: hypothetical protein [Actinotignum]|uniref:hypothetical protein n=1 Tax=Actinotignum TaxID=1653174 RepID=UPI00254E9D78|nr:MULTISPECIES: hypothetical protein [Actinotignum]MDE1536990.1 hypothetical protein [Actinotignum schaalii]MDK7272365.1 hypothetical protein [Actinotignum schaalii]MDY5144693.1 hypothetical protein [Actinotignum timonense]
MRKTIILRGAAHVGVAILVRRRRPVPTPQPASTVHVARGCALSLSAGIARA